MTATMVALVAMGSGTAAPTMGSGTAAPTMGSGTAAPTMGSGTAAPTMASGTAAPTMASGTAAPTMGSGTAAPTKSSSSSSPPPLHTTHRVVLDTMNKYVMQWTPRNEDIIFDIQVATNGYVGLGFSPNGGMKGADIVLGWVDDSGKVFLHDRHATGYAVPVIDESQDVTLLGGYQNDTHTVLRFSRPWTTCDTLSDLQLSDDTVRVIWSYGEEDPTDATTLKKHTHRGSKSLFLRQTQFVQPSLSEDVKFWEIFSPNVRLPAHLTTLYWCKLHKVPPLPLKTHVIGFVPVIEERNVEHVHHILLYECHLPDSARHYDKWVDLPGSQCYGANMPVSWKYCTSPIVAWAIGGQGEMYPKHAGLPLGEEHGGATYFLMETHYDNPNLNPGVVDASGLRIFYTERLRQYDAGILMVGHSVSPMHIIPPNHKWTSVGLCDSSCTLLELPAGGLQVFQGLLHSHLLGRGLSLRHIREAKELPPLLKDMTYDFNYQQTRVLTEEVTVLPGDYLITECTYDATNRHQPTFGGFNTEEEMCLGFIAYYPRVNLSMCTSAPLLDTVLASLGIQDIYNKKQVLDVDEEAETELAEALRNGSVTPEVKAIKLAQLLRKVVVKAPDKYVNMSLYDILEDKATWEDTEMAAVLQEMVVFGAHSSTCRTRDSVRVLDQMTTVQYPSYAALQSTVEQCVADRPAVQDQPGNVTNSLQPPTAQDQPRNVTIKFPPPIVKDQPGNVTIKFPPPIVKDQPRNVTIKFPPPIIQDQLGNVTNSLRRMMFTHREVLDRSGRYIMLWTPRKNDIIIELQVATKGYVGLGFSSNGGMKGADIVLGWVDDSGKVFLHDRYATGYSVPMLDESQDVTLLGGYQNDTHTVLRFSRPWTTCELHTDFQISANAVRVIWSYDKEDPTDIMAMKWHDQRGTRSLLLQQPQAARPSFSSDVKTWDLLSPNVSLPVDQTGVNWCKLYKTPVSRKVHVIGFVPVIEERNVEHVHHILLYECHLPDSARHYDKWVDLPGSQCYGANMPVSWKYCTSPIVAWAIGGQGEMFPQHVGLPMGEEHGGATFFLMETRYDNPNLKQGVVDASGLRIFYTERLRQYDAGILMVGHSVSPMHIIPPNHKWTSVGLCDSSCTLQELPAGGVQVFQGLLHAHLLGRSLSLRHIREAQELPPLLKDTTYDFRYHESSIVMEETSVLPGDTLITECTYDATHRHQPTFGGFGAEEESCLAFLAYYPRVNLSTCTSVPSLNAIFDVFGIQDIYDKEETEKIFRGRFYYVYVNILIYHNQHPYVTDTKYTDYTPGVCVYIYDHSHMCGSLRCVSFFRLEVDEEAETALRNGSVTPEAQLLRKVVVKAPDKYLNVSFYDLLHDETTWRNRRVQKALQKAVLGTFSTICGGRQGSGVLHVGGSLLRRYHTVGLLL
nr:uncharacterized protein LOC123769364 [Procambarus clarkii]